MLDVSVHVIIILLWSALRDLEHFNDQITSLWYVWGPVSYAVCMFKCVCIRFVCTPAHVSVYLRLKLWEITQKCQQRKSGQIPSSFSPCCFWYSVAVHPNLICQYTNSSPLLIMSACLPSDCMCWIPTRGIFAEWLIEWMRVILGMNKYELALHLWSECNCFIINKVSMKAHFSMNTFRWNLSLVCLSYKQIISLCCYLAVEWWFYFPKKYFPH